MAPNVNQKNPYKTRIGGCTCTVFVPYDCNNNCPVCINKKESADTSKFSLEKIIESIKIVDSITPACDFVFTGGEPFANLSSLEKMLNTVPNTHKIYINTTFPVQPNITEDETIDFISGYKDNYPHYKGNNNMWRYKRYQKRI